MADSDRLREFPLLIRVKDQSGGLNTLSFATEIADNEAHLVVFELAIAEMLKSQGKYNQAIAHESRAAGIRSAMLSSYFMQSNTIQQSLPMGPGISPHNFPDGFNRRISVNNG